MASAHTNHTESASALTPIERIRILYVEDDQLFTDLTTTNLNKRDEDDQFSIETASTPKEGLELLDGEIDCIISDYDMPGMNGIEFLRTVREEYPDLPFLLFTGKGSEEVASDAISAGVTDYLQKDGSPEQYALLSNRIWKAVRRYRSEQELHRMRERYRRVFERSNDAIMLIDPPRGVIRDANTQACDMLGYDHEELLSLSPADLHPEETGRFKTFVEDVYEEGSGWTDELTCYTSDGRELPTEISATTIEVDEQESLLAIIRDITDRRERQEDLEILQTAIDNAHIPMVLADPDQKENPMVYVNDAFTEVTGYTRSESVGRNCRFLQGDGTRPEKVARIREALEAEEPVTVELRNYRKDGTMFWNRLTIQPVYDADGTLLRYFASQEDITERKERREALVRQNDRLDRFVRAISHDLRNPLQTASGYVELAREDCESDHLDTVADALDRSQRLIDDLLTTARSDDRVTETTRVGLRDVVTDCWQAIESPEATVEIDTQQTVRADRTRLQQLLKNLLRNAIEHGGNGVTITVGELDDGFYVEDDGCGIPEDERDEVFEAGYTTAEDGTGFGLSIVKQVTEAHEWEIRATDGSDGGARFEITDIELAGA